MAQYRCISCGEIKESEKQCSCPVCGYRMFETPYDNTEVLKSEIKRFLTFLRPKKIDQTAMSFFRKVPVEKKKDKQPEEKPQFNTVYKAQDDGRFPGFEKIQGYVCSSQKTETFYERLNTSIEQIRNHIHEPYAQKYEVGLKTVSASIDTMDKVLREALPAVGIELELSEAVMPEVRMLYTETPDEELVKIADGMLDDLASLAEKIRRFIRQNNMYGNIYQKRPGGRFKASEKNNPAEDLENCAGQLSEVLAKNYVVDIFEDGSSEMKEMLKVLWRSVDAIMTLPVLAKRSTFVLEDGTEKDENEIGETILRRINRRYAALDDIIDAYDFLSDKNEDQLFTIYDKLIMLDPFTVMGVNKYELLKSGESESKLNEMIGLDGIKASIKKIKAYALKNKDSDDLNIHMCFLGNPGTGKTEVARYIAGILYENKILPTKKVIEVDRSGLVSQYFGATAEKTRGVIDRAMGGVLFVDEAYALGNNSEGGSITDYGKEAIDTLVKAMEDHRGRFCVILAGYKNEMLNMLSTNPGFKSRIQFTLDFPNYSRDELQQIMQLMLEKRKYTVNQAAMDRILDITDVKRKEPNFANAREIRNILDQVIMCQNVRCAGTEEKEVGLVDVNQYIRDANISLPTSGEGAQKKVLSGEEELDQLIGLASVKRMVRKIKAYAKRNKGEADFNLHMCFYGNPGTGKTEVARIISRILYDAGVLAEAKLVETDGQGLIGRFVGETAPKTEAKINDAMNGVLFIDEAYSLANTGAADGNSSGYGDEAIAVLLKGMEDKRGRICVILAGYRDEMKKMLSANPGFESRIQFTLEFPDYTREELGEIARRFLLQKKYAIENDALERLLDITEYYRKRPNFANARTVRNVLDQVIMNQNLRTEDMTDDATIIVDDVEDYLMDEEIDLEERSVLSRRIGF